MAKEDRAVGRKELEKDQVRQDTQNDERYDEQEGRSDEQDKLAASRYKELHARYTFLKWVAALVAVVVMLGAGFVGSYVKQSRDTAKGGEKFNCLVVAALEAQAIAEQKIVGRTKGQVQKDHKNSAKVAGNLAAKGRSVVSCPPTSSLIK